MIAEARQDFLLEILHMSFIPEDFARKEHRHAGLLRGFERQVKTFFRTDAPQAEREVALSELYGKAVDVDAVLNRRENARTRRT